jgi:hypothetical protein
MQNGSYSLIDQIVTNSRANVLFSGSIINEISNHFMTFLQPNLTKYKAKPKETKHRLINEQTIENFRNSLANTDWRSVFSDNNVNSSYSKFWEIYNNLHKICNFMTPGLLQSRKTKLNLRKISLNDPSVTNLENYKNFRNLYNTTLRGSKKVYFEQKIQQNKKNLKKTWDTLKEATYGSLSQQNCTHF